MPKNQIKPKKSRRAKKILDETPRLAKIEGVNLSVAPKHTGSKLSSPHVLDLKELIKQQTEQKQKAITTKTYFRESLYNFWTNQLKDSDKINSIEPRKSLDQRLEELIRLIVSIKNRIRTNWIDFTLRLSKKRNETAADFTLLFRQKPSLTTSPRLEKNSPKIRAVWDWTKLKELTLVNLIQFWGWSLLILIKLVAKLISGPISLIHWALKKLRIKFSREGTSWSGDQSQEIFRLNPPSGWQRALIGFMALAFILALPIQAFTYYGQLQNSNDKISTLTLGAIRQLNLGQKDTADFNLTSAEEKFQKAEAGFVQAQNEFDQINSIIANLITLLPKKGTAFKNGQALISAGKNISEISQALAAIMKDLNLSENGLTDKISFIQNRLDLILERLDKVITDLNQVDPSTLPTGYGTVFSKIQNSLPLFKSSLSELSDLSTLALDLLGQDRMKRYLVIFQNNSELRPTGGFIGSFALLDLDRGKIERLEIPAGGSYDLKGSLRVKVISPQPLHLVNPDWQFQDANWFADFPASAQKLIWFYEKSGGPSVDGVIALNATLVQNLLNITGPIALPAYQKIINRDNFLTETQTEVEFNYQDRAKPKQFIADLLPKLLDQLFKSKPEQVLQILSLLQNSLQSKDLIFYSTLPETEQTILNLGWGGEIKDPPAKSDYLLVVNSNVAGGKTDLVIKQKIEHWSRLLDDGSIIDNLIITRTHNGIKDDPFTGAKNVDYLKIYVPQGSTLIEAAGFQAPPPSAFLRPDLGYEPDQDLLTSETNSTTDPQSGTIINNEFSKTVFANWLSLAPGETKTVSLKYQLPFKLKLEPTPINQNETWLDRIKRTLGFKTDANLIYYTFLVQKQPGSSASEFSSTLSLPKDLAVFFSYPSDLVARQDKTLEFKTSLDSDQTYGLILQKQ